MKMFIEVLKLIKLFYPRALTLITYEFSCFTQYRNSSGVLEC